MPDGDVVSRRIRFAWRAAYEGIQGLGDKHVIAARVAKALTASLRASCGITDFPEIISIVADFRGGGRTLGECHQALRDLCGPGHWIHAAAIQAAGRCLSEPIGNVELKREVAVAIVQEIAEVALFAKSVVRLAEDTTLTQHEAEQFVRDCRVATEDEFLSIASQLVVGPTGNRFKARPHRRVRKTTQDLLEESIV